MIIYDRLLKPGGGNMGNFLFELCGMIGLARRYNVDVKFPDNLIFKYFKNPPETYFEQDYMMEVSEKTYRFDWGQWDEYIDLFENFTINIKGWLQDARYWEHCKTEVLKALEIKDEYTDWVRNKYSKIFTKPTIAISVRRGDYCGNSNYVLLPITYYLEALIKNFPDFRENYNLVLFSDDIGYCKVHFTGPNVFFAEGTPIEQHILGRFCDNYILANSTFSYWLAYPNQNKQRVITPTQLFAGKLLEKEGNENFWGTW